MSTNNEELLEVINELSRRLNNVESSLEKKLDEIISLLKDIKESK